MALYAIGDTHLSLTSNKPMDVFGGGWEGYVDKLQKGFAAVGPEDTVVLCGDLSWRRQRRTSLSWTPCLGRESCCSRETTTTGGTPPPR